jgi:hypothetical protein
MTGDRPHFKATYAHEELVEHFLLIETHVLNRGRLAVRSPQD